MPGTICRFGRKSREPLSFLFITMVKPLTVLFFIGASLIGSIYSDECAGDNDDGVTVIVSFDSLNDRSQEFFINQLKPNFETLSKCVKWHFIPCSTSKIRDSTLTCCDGPAACQLNVLHACAAHYYEKDQIKLGNFFLCMMTDDCQYVKGEGCAKQAGMDWNLLKACKPGDKAAEWCDNRYRQLDSRHVVRIPGIFYNWRYNIGIDDKSFADLKEQACIKLKEKNIQCEACNC